jgi:thioredoxin-like negative regulator of GroEL/predicted aspartyl protease
MDDSGPAVSNLVRALYARKIIAFLVAAFALIFVCSAIAQTSKRLDSAAVRKIAKQSRRLTRAESLAEAEKLLRDTLATNPDSGDIKTELAYVLSKRHKLREAYDLAYSVCEVEPKNSRAFAVLGYVMLSAGRFAEARPLFYTSLKIDRHEHLGWAGLGMLDFYENNVPSSIDNLQAAVNEAPGEPDYLYTFAQVNARAENFRQAAEAFEQFLHVSSSMDTDRRDRIRGLIAFLRYIGQKGKLYSATGDHEALVNFALEGNRPIITLKVNNDDRPLRFVLDTGSGITVISQETAKSLHIKSITKGGFAKGIGGTGRFEIVYGFLRSIDIGGVCVREVPVYIRKFHTEQSTVDGYIGLAMISKFLTTIDYGNNTFSLMRRDDPRAVADPGSLQLPLRLTSSGFLSGQVQIEGIDPSLNFIVDTGASVSVISDSVAATGAMTPFASADKLRVIGSAGITDDVPTFLLPKLSFGPHSQRQVQAVALDLDLINEATGFEQEGILGGNFLRNYRLTFDFKNSKVNFTPVVPALAR